MDFQGSLFEAPGPAARPSFDGLERRPLSRGAWIDVHRAWLPDADAALAALVADVPWRAERRQMYDRLVDVPRLVHTYGVGEALPHPVLDAARDALSAHYLPELGEPFVTAGCCYYRDGRDSVAWHGDTIGRGRTRTPWSRSSRSATRAGSLLRPRGGGESIAVEPRPRRPGGDGRLLPAHLGARGAQGRARRPADLGAVSAAPRLLVGLGPARSGKALT